MVGSGKYCAVVGCNNSYKKLKNWRDSECEHHKPLLGKDCPCLEPFKFHAFPKMQCDWMGWLSAINRESLKVTKSSVVCSIHFVDGKPTALNPKPSLHLAMRLKKGRKKCSAPYSECNMDMDITFDDHNVKQVTQTNSESADHVYSRNSGNNGVMVNKYAQTDLPPFSFASDVRTDEKCRFYTGIELNSFMELISILQRLEVPKINVDLVDQLLILLMHLRLGLLLKDLGFRFGLSVTTVTDIVQNLLKLLADEVKDYIIWLPRKTIQKTMPSVFKEVYPGITCVVDITEVHLEHPYQTHSTYKSRNSCKFLVCVAPDGFITFISKAIGGQACDDSIMKKSGLLDLLSPGDELLADRYYAIDDFLASRQVKLKAPAFMRGRRQLTKMDANESRIIAPVRIHVEKIIKRFQDFRILSSNMKFKSVNNVERMAIVCAALCNMGKPNINSS